MSVDTQTFPSAATSEQQGESSNLTVKERNQLIIDAARQEGRIPKDIGGLACGTCLLAPICLAGGETNCDSSGGQVKDGLDEIVPSVTSRSFEELFDNDDGKPDKIESSVPKSFSTAPFTRSKAETPPVQKEQRKIEKVVIVEPASQPVQATAVLVESTVPIKSEGEKKPDVAMVDIADTLKTPVAIEETVPVVPIVNKQLSPPRSNENPILVEALPESISKPSASILSVVKTNQPKSPESIVDSPKPSINEASAKSVMQVARKLAVMPAQFAAHKSTPRTTRLESKKSAIPKAVEQKAEPKCSKSTSLSTKTEILRSKADNTVIVASDEKVQSPEVAPVVRKSATSHGESVKTELQPKKVLEAESVVPTGLTDTKGRQPTVQPIHNTEMVLSDAKPDVSSVKAEPVAVKNEDIRVAELETGKDKMVTSPSAEVGDEAQPDSVLFVEKELELYPNTPFCVRDLEAEVYVNIPRDAEEAEMIKDQVIEVAPVSSEFVEKDFTGRGLTEEGDSGSSIAQQTGRETEGFVIESVVSDEPAEDLGWLAIDTISEAELETSIKDYPAVTMSDVVDEEERRTYWREVSNSQEEEPETLLIDEDEATVVQARGHTSTAASSRPKAPLRIAGVLGAIASFHVLSHTLGLDPQVK